MKFGLAAAVLAVVVVGVAVAADPPAPADAKALDKAVVDSLRDVHNRGADLYNQDKDYPGAYRVYEGALLTVKPLLSHRPVTQKAITDGLAAAREEQDVARRAFLLHEVIEKVRADLKGTAPRPPEPKKVDDTKQDDKKSTTPPPKKPVETKKPDEPKQPDEPKKSTEPKKPTEPVEQAPPPRAKRR